MATLQKKSLSTPDETRTSPKAKVETVMFGDSVLLRITYEPGWRWSEHLQSVLGTESCQVHHFGYGLGGQIHVVMEDGTTMDFAQGDALVIPPGHDAWVVGK